MCRKPNSVCGRQSEKSPSGFIEFAEITVGLMSPGRIANTEVRAPDGLEYVDTVADHVRVLQVPGVSSENITVVGFGLVGS